MLLFYERAIQSVYYFSTIGAFFLSLSLPLLVRELFLTLAGSLLVAFFGPLDRLFTALLLPLTEIWLAILSYRLSHHGSN